MIEHLVLLKIRNMEDINQHGLASIVYRIFDKKNSDSGVKNENISNKELAKEIHKPIIKLFQNWQVHSPFIDNL